MKKKVLALVLAIVVVAVLCIGLVACNKDAIITYELEIPKYDGEFESYDINPDFKLGMICLHGEESTYDKNFIDAMRNAWAELGLKSKNLIIKTNIPETSECATAARELAEQHCNIIFADSFGHESFMRTVAGEYPNIQFCHATGTTAHDADAPENFHNAFASIYEGRYLAGVVAGMKLNEMIDAGQFTAEQAKMGYVGAFTYAEVISGYTAFYLGAKSVCPTVTMDVQFTGSWYDVTAEKSAAEVLIGKGCKLISQHADSMGAPDACEEAGVPNVSYNGSTIDSCPKTFLVSSKINWAPYFKYIIIQAAAGREIGDDIVGSILTDSVQLTGLNGGVVAEGTLKKVLEVRDELVKGKRFVFDCANFTVTGENFNSKTMVADAQGHLTSYMADVNTDKAYTADTQVIEQVGDKYVFMESEHRSAPYFDILIDGINLLNTNFGD